MSSCSWLVAAVSTLAFWRLMYSFNSASALRTSPSYFRNRVQGLIHLRFLKPMHIEQGERFCPIQGLANTGDFFQVKFADRLDHFHHLIGEMRGNPPAP